MSLGVYIMSLIKKKKSKIERIIEKIKTIMENELFSPGCYDGRSWRL